MSKIRRGMLSKKRGSRALRANAIRVARLRKVQ